MKSFNIKVLIPKSINSIWWIIISLFISFSGSAQTSFPVRANIQIIPPYSPYLSDYTAPGSEKLAVTFLLNDPNEAALRVKLKISIEGVGISIQTHPDFQPLPLTIEGGFQEQLTAEDLAQYFDVNNLLFEGFTKQQYLKNAALPEGLYKFSVQAYDVQRNVAVSNKAVSTVWITLNDPPLLVSPYNTSKVTVIYPQNLIFQWMRRQNSPNAANTEYHFKLVQIYPAGRNPNDAINSSVPVYETTTSNTSLYYGLSEPQLVPGYQYAWRVQAKEEGGKDMYKNNGYTETWMFTYGDPCKAPENIQLEVQSPKMVKLQWNEAPGAKKYIVHYRLKGFDSPSDWYKEEAFMTSSTINGLKAGNKYEYQIECVCEGASELSPVDTFSTFPNNTNKDCGKPFEVKVPDGSTRLSTLNINDILTVDGFNVRIAEASGSNGVFSGKGVAYIPFLNAYLKMNFASITVNAQYQVVSGNIAADKADLSKYRNRIPAKNNVDFCNDNPNETISKPKNTVTENNPKGGNNQGKVIVINDEVEVKEGDKIKLNGKDTTVAKDTKLNKGDVVTVDGEKIKVNTVSEKSNGDNSGGKPQIAQVRFTPSADQKYGFDEKTNDLLSSKYSLFQNPVSKTTEYVSWKSVETGRQDYVSATISGTSNDFDFSKLKFTTASGSSLNVQETSDKNNLKVTLQGSMSGDAQEVTAFYQMKEDEHQTLSKVNVVSYEKIYRKVVLVPLTGVANIPSLDNIKDQLNKIYGPAIAEWNVTVAPSYAPEKWDENGDTKIETGDGGLLSNYTSEMRSIIKSYKNSTSSFDKDACYVLLAGEAAKAGQLGYMPRAKQYGFIFTSGMNEASLSKTIAHELGHGAFHLKHIFDETSVSQRTTNNLMDYGSGVGLHKYQWDQVHDPSRVVGFLEEEEDAALTSDCSWFYGLAVDQDCKDLMLILNNIKSSYEKKVKLIVRNPVKSAKLSYNQSDLTIEKTNYKNINIYNYLAAGKECKIDPTAYEVKESKTEPKFYTIAFHNMLSKHQIVLEINVHDDKAAVKKDSLVKYLFGGKKKVVEEEVKEVISFKTLTDIFPNSDRAFLLEAFPYLNKYMRFFNINTPIRISHFLGQIGVEVEYFSSKEGLKENLRYTQCNIKHNLCRKCYSLTEGDHAKCPTKKGNCTSKYSGDRLDMCEHPANYAGNDEKIAMAAYNGFMGRGFIHLTWEENYLNNYNYLISKKLMPKNFIAEPSLLSSDIETAVMSACGFFEKEGCLKEADKDNFDGVMRIVNKHDTNKSTKRELVNLIKSIIND